MADHETVFVNTVLSNIDDCTLTFLRDQKCTTFHAMNTFVKASLPHCSSKGESRLSVVVRTLVQLVTTRYPNGVRDNIVRSCRMLFYYCVSTLKVNDRLQITWQEDAIVNTYNCTITEIGSTAYTYIVACHGHPGEWHFDASIDAWSALHI